MKNQYVVLRKKHQEEVNAFPMKAAFSDEQFENILREWGYSRENYTEHIITIGAGMYMKKDDLPAFREMCRRHRSELTTAVSEDKTGDGFVYQMFYYELCNHEFAYTEDLSDTLSSLGYTMEQVNSNPVLLAGLNKAINKVYASEWC